MYNIFPCILSKPLRRAVALTALLLSAIATPMEMKAKSDYEAYIDSADNYASREHYVEAARCYREALRANPGSPLNSKIFANLGICLTETGQLTEAIDALDVALVREPSSPHILTSRARALLLSDRRQDALTDLDAALAADSLHLPALRLRSQLHMLTADYPKAETDFTTIHTHYPAEDLGAIGLAQCHMMRGDFDAAITLYREAITLADEADTHVALASALLNARRNSEAGEMLREAIRLHPRCGELYLMRGVLHQRMYRTEEAMTDKKTALSLGVDPAKADAVLPGKVK